MARWVRNPFGEWVNIDRYDVVKVTRMYGPIHVMALRGDDHVGLFEAENWDEAQAWLDRIMQAEEHIEIDGDALARAIGEKAGQ